jgi:hypothetical protein
MFPSCCIDWFYCCWGDILEKNGGVLKTTVGHDSIGMGWGKPTWHKKLSFVRIESIAVFNGDDELL